MKIAVVGDIGVDEYTNLHLRKPGGIALNFAMSVLEAGSDASIISAIGTDSDSHKISSLLKKLSLDSSHIHKIDGISPLQKIRLEKNGERFFTGYSPGILNRFSLQSSDISFILLHNAVFVPFSDGMEEVFHQVRKIEGNIKKVVDFSQDSILSDFDSEDNVIQKYCQDFDIIFVGGDKKRIQQLTSLSNVYPNKIFILTLGENGSIAWQAGEKYERHSLKVASITDTTGCGDAFQATFLISYLTSRNIVKSLEKGAQKAAYILSHVGSTSLSFQD